MHSGALFQDRVIAIDTRYFFNQIFFNFNIKTPAGRNHIRLIGTVMLQILSVVEYRLSFRELFNIMPQ